MFRKQMNHSERIKMAPDKLFTLGGLISQLIAQEKVDAELNWETWEKIKSLYAEIRPDVRNKKPFATRREKLAKFWEGFFQFVFGGPPSYYLHNLFMDFKEEVQRWESILGANGYIKLKSFWKVDQLIKDIDDELARRESEDE